MRQASSQYLENIDPKEAEEAAGFQRDYAGALEWCGESCEELLRCAGMSSEADSAVRGTRVLDIWAHHVCVAQRSEDTRIVRSLRAGHVRESDIVQALLSDTSHDDLLKLQRLQCERMAMQKWQGLSTPKLYERAIKEKLYQPLEDSALLDKLCYEPTKFRTDVLHHIVQRKWGAQLADVEDEAVV